MKITLTAAGSPASGRTTALNWITKQLESMGATVVQSGEHHITIVATKDFLTPVPQKEANTPVPKSALQLAHEIVHGDRENTYGSPDKNLNTIAQYWSTHLTASTGEKLSLTALDVCSMMVLLKQARLANNPTHFDSMVDVAGYTALRDILCSK